LYIRKVFFISKLALSAVLAFVIVRTAMIPQEMGITFAPSPAAGTETISAAAGGPEETLIEDYSAIVTRNIFSDANYSPDGNEDLQDDDAGRPLQSAEEELGLALVGTVSGSPAVSRAIIKDIRTNILNLYKAGQTVGGVCVESIEKNAVILLHNGQRKTLTLKTSVESDNESVSQPNRAVKPDSPLTGAPSSIPGKIEQVEETLGKAVVEPYVVKGQVEGLRITGLEEISAAKDLGLKNGDIICVVNGQRVTSMQKAYQIFKKARTQASTDIELLRGDEHQKLSFTQQ